MKKATYSASNKAMPGFGSQQSGLASSQEKRRNQLLWLILLIAFTIVLVCACSWISTFQLLPSRVYASGGSKLSANYGQWDKPIGEFNFDMARLATASILDSLVTPNKEVASLPGQFTATPLISSSTRIPTQTMPATVVKVTSFAGATQTPGASSTPRPTATARPFVTSTPSPVPTPSASSSPVPTIPSVPTSRPPRPTRTPTPPLTNTPTLTPTNTPSLTPVPLQVSFGAATYSINENDGSGVASISVQLNQVAGTTVTVVCQVNGATPGSATNTFDYAFISTVVTFTPGQTSQTCDVPLIDDIVYEGDETVNLELVSPTGGASLGTPQNTVLTIVDDEAIPTVQFLTTAYSINESDPGVIDIPVVLSGPTQANATVDFSIGGTAPGSDYTLSPSGPPITFSGGLTVQTLSFNTNDNGAVDGTRTVTITLSSPSANLTLGGSTQTTISIIDDDSAPTCVGAAPGAGEPQVLTTPPGGSPPFGTSTDIACGQSLVVNLGGLALLADGNSDYDLVFYESYTGTGIQLDWVVVQVGTSAAGPWYTVFYWGDQIADTNTNVSSGVEADNAVIPQASLYNLAGILIDIDFAAPPGVYQYVRIFSPNNTGADASQVDALQVCQASPCP